MKCPQCQQDNPGDARFGNGCGARLVLTCPSCDQPNPPVAVGDTTNLAARLLASVAPGQILISENLARPVGRYFTLNRWARCP